jgi:hypothetical protein
VLAATVTATGQHSVCSAASTASITGGTEAHRAPRAMGSGVCAAAGPPPAAPLLLVLMSMV